MTTANNLYEIATVASRRIMKEKLRTEMKELNYILNEMQEDISDAADRGEFCFTVGFEDSERREYYNLRKFTNQVKEFFENNKYGVVLNDVCISIRWDKESIKV